HVREHLGLGHRVPVLEGQQRGHRRRAAAEVVLLRHRGPVARRLQADHRQRVRAPVGHAHLRAVGPRGARGCEQGQAQGRQAPRQHGARAGHGPCPPMRTLTAVPFWMSTLAPLFWITVLMPAALPKAPPVTVLPAPTVPVAVLPPTSPWLSLRTTTRTDSPPRSSPSASPGRASPKPSTGAGASAGASASAPARTEVRNTGMAPSLDGTAQRGRARDAPRSGSRTGGAQVEA